MRDTEVALFLGSRGPDGAASDFGGILVVSRSVVNLLDMHTKWQASSTSEGVFEGRDSR